MSIDTLLEAARYLEWQAQQQQITRENEQRKDKELLNREAESSLRVELVTSLSQPIRANHVTWGNDSHRQQLHHPPPPPPSLQHPQVPIAVIPMVPVVTATPSVPPLPRTAQIASAATSLNGSPPAKNSSSPPQQQQQQQQPASPHLLCSPHIKVETSLQLLSADLSQTQIKVENSPQIIGAAASPSHLKAENSSQLVGAKPSPSSHVKVENGPQLIGAKPSPSPPPIQIQYATSLATNGSGSQHALLPHQAPPSSQPRPNGVTLEDLRGMEGKRRPGGAGTREVHNKLEKNRRAHLKECFETLKKNVPNVDEKKTSNLSVLRSALRYIQTLKRKEKEYEHEMERLAREKISTQQRLAELKNELSQCMDVVEIDRVLRQTIQPEDDQASTSTASEGEDNFEQDMDEDAAAAAPPPAAPPLSKPPVLQAPPLLAPHLSIQHAALPLSGVLTTPSASAPPQAIAPAPPTGPPPPQPAHPIQPAAMQVQPTVIAHAAVSHPSVIQAVNHGLPTNHKHLTHIAPSPGPIAAAPAAAQPIGHITVHPVAHLPSHLPTLYPQGVSVSQPAVVGHITHTFAHHTLPHVQAGPQANANGAQVNSAAVIGQGSPSLGKPTAVLAPHPQLVGQAAVLNPVTMVTVPTFPVSTLKLA